MIMNMIRKDYYSKIFILMLVLIFFLADFAYSLRVPVGVDNIGEIIIDKMLLEIEEAVANYNKNNIDHKKDLIYIYIRQWQFLKALGVLDKTARVFIPLSGHDFFPGCFGNHLYTSDKNFKKNTIKKIYKRFWEAMKINEIVAKLPFKISKNVKIDYHDQANVITDEAFIKRWTSQMKQGDVVVLKFVFKYLLHHLTSGRMTPKPISESEAIPIVLSWINSFIEALPEGVYIVVYEDPKQNVKNDAKNSGLLANHLSINKKIKNVLREALNPQQYNKFQNITNGINELTTWVEMPFSSSVVFHFGGLLSVWKTKNTDELLAVPLSDNLVFLESIFSDI